MGCRERISKEELNIESRRCLQHPATGYIYEGDVSMDTLPPHTQESKPCYVYELVDPRNQSIFYVGITLDLYGRYRQHMRCDGTNPQKDMRIQEILESGHLMIMRTIECVKTSEEASVSEKRWIWNYRVAGVRLLNIAVPRYRHRGLGINVPDSQKSTRRTRQSMPTFRTPGSPKEKTFAAVIDMLVGVRETGKWPDDVSPQMRRYYRREYPEFFQNGKRWAKIREERIQKANQLRAHPRRSRSRRNGHK